MRSQQREQNRSTRLVVEAENKGTKSTMTCNTILCPKTPLDCILHTFVILLPYHIVEEPLVWKVQGQRQQRNLPHVRRVFGDCCNSMKYALTPTRLSQRGFELVSDTDTDDLNDKLLINAKITDSSDGSTQGRTNSSMNISHHRSGEKRKDKHAKGKYKKFGAREVSESVDNLASALREMASVIRSKEEGRMTLHECINDFLSTGLVTAGDELHVFALWSLRNSNNRVVYSVVKTPELRFRWISYCFERDKMSGFRSR